MGIRYRLVILTMWVEKNLLRALTRGRYQIIQEPVSVRVTGFSEDVNLNDSDR